MDRSQPFRILALVGSHRSGSYNQALLAAAREEAPAHVAIDDFDLRALPYYDGDLEAAGDPAPVQELKRAVRTADALLFYALGDDGQRSVTSSSRSSAPHPGVAGPSPHRSTCVGCSRGRVRRSSKTPSSGSPGRAMSSRTAP